MKMVSNKKLFSASKKLNILSKLPLTLALVLGSTSAVQAAKYEVSFKSAHNKYFVSELNGSGAVNANRSSIGNWEKFHINDLDDGGCIRHGEQVTINSGNNWYWQPAYKIGGGILNQKDLKASYWYVGLLRDAPSEIKFNLTNHSDTAGCLANGDQISLQSVSTGKYIVGESDGDALVDRSAIGSWEKVTVTVHQELEVDPDISFVQSIFQNNPLVENIVPEFLTLADELLEESGLLDAIGISELAGGLSSFYDLVRARGLSILYHAAREDVPLGNVDIPHVDRVESEGIHDLSMAKVNAYANSNYTVEDWSQGNDGAGKKSYGTSIFAKLYRAELTGSAADLESAKDHIRIAAEYGPWGTTGGTASPLPWVEADYDFAEVRLAAILWRFKDVLDSESEQHLLDLMVSDGPAGLTALGLFSTIDALGNPSLLFMVPETENHILKTEGTRYLKNKWLRDNGNTDPQYNNDSNGVAEFLEKYIQHTIDATVFEYNSMPYGESTLMALMNLEAFGEGAVQAKSRELLDNMMFKYALSSFDGYRWAPMRRRHYGYGNYSDDDTTSMARALVVNADVNGSYPNWGSSSLSARSTMVIWASAMPYRIPHQAFDLIKSTEKSYFVTLGRGNLTSPEMYSAGPGYLLTAGGAIADRRSDTFENCNALPFGPSCSDQVTRSTTLILEDMPLSRHADGFRMSGGNVEGTHGYIMNENASDDWYEFSYGDFNNTCVFENFACSAARVWAPSASTLSNNGFSLHCENSPTGASLSSIANTTDNNLNQWCVYTTPDNDLHIGVYSSDTLGVMALMPNESGLNTSQNVLNALVLANTDVNTLNTLFRWPTNVSGTPSGTISYDRHAADDQWAITGVSYDQESFNYLSRDYQTWPQINLMTGSVSPSANTVRIELDNSHLQIREVEVQIDGQWHYLNSNSFDSDISARDKWSIHNAAHYAGDGNPTGNMYHSKTSSGTNWWQAVLSGVSGEITNIRIRTREDAYGYRIDNARIYLGGNQIGTWDWDGAYTKTFYASSNDSYVNETPANSDGSGNAIFLDRHVLDCGIDGIRSFKLYRPSNTQIAYKYHCAYDNSASVSAWNYTAANDDGGGHTAYLDRHGIDCGSKPIKAFGLTRPSSSQFSYKYKCGGVALNNVSDRYTSWDSNGQGNLIFLDRQNVTCGDNELMTYARLQTNWATNQFRYHYRCGKK